MAAPRGKSEQTKAEILAAARLIFAERGFTSVSIRDIAKAAGVTHGLVHYYFDTRERLISEVIRAEVASSAELLLAHPIDGSSDSRDVMRRVVHYVMTEGRTAAVLIARAQLEGLEPEKMRQPGRSGILALVAQRLAELQKETDPCGPRLDPALVSAYIGAATLAFAIMHPWLMTGVGLGPEDYESRVHELVEISVMLLAVAGGIPPGTA
jgi:AcrR family transcriptional regulator